MTIDASAAAVAIARQEDPVAIGLLSQRSLVWMKFREHRLAFWSAILVVLIYLVGIFCEFVAPRAPDFYDPAFTMLAPQRVHFLYTDDSGRHFQPHVTGFTSSRDPQTLRRVFVPDPERPYPDRPLRPRRALQALGPVPFRHPPDRPDGPDPALLPARLRPARPRRPQPPRLRHPRLDLDRPRRRRHQPRARRAPRRHLGLLRRHRRQRHPARHRVPDVGADDPALDGPRRRDPGHLVADPRLFHHHHHHLADRLDRAGARGARPLHVLAQRALRDRRPARRHQRDAHHHAPSGARASPATSSPR